MYLDTNDIELLSYIREENEEALNVIYKKYEPVIKKIASNFFHSNNVVGFELSDLIQEGNIGFSNAIRTYNEHKEILFYTYAVKCIEAKIISALIMFNRQKHKFLNQSLSLDKEVEETSKNKFEALLEDKNSNPELLLVELEETELLDKAIKELLTEFELEVYELKIRGFDYKEIAIKLDKDVKSIDNALTRIKKKAKSILR